MRRGQPRKTVKKRFVDNGRFRRISVPGLDNRGSGLGATTASE